MTIKTRRSRKARWNWWKKDIKIKRKEKKVSLAEATHTPLTVDVPCPLEGCEGDTAVMYPGHKGLLVCQGCNQTFDPEVWFER